MTPGEAGLRAYADLLNRADPTRRVRLVGEDELAQRVGDPTVTTSRQIVSTGTVAPTGQIVPAWTVAREKD